MIRMLKTSILVGFSTCAILSTSATAQNVNLINGNSAPTQSGVLTLGASATSNGYTWIQSWNGMPLAINPVGNGLGIATTTPATLFDVYGSASFGVPNFGGNGLNSPGKFEILTGGASPISDRLVFGTDNSGWRMAISKNSSGVISDLMTLQDNGNVGIGTTTPGSTLEVNGNVKLSSGSGASLTFADGTKQTTAWTGVLCGGDYAEDVETTGDKAKYEPGDVLVISASSDKDVQKSQEPYSTGVSGIYATKPGVVGKRESLANASDAIPMAMVGIVPTKVSAENGPIRRGDLLVTSSRAGYAMRGTDRTKMLGAVIGKAMGTLDSGSGVIEVLVTLQ